MTRFLQDLANLRFLGVIAFTLAVLLSPCLLALLR